jgi:hypothetical protein
VIDEHMLEKRLRHLETCTFEESIGLANIQKSIEDLKTWIGNGVSEKIARVAGQMLMERLAEIEEKRWQREREERKLELAEQVEKNREYGAKRDAEAKERAEKLAAEIAAQEAARDRRMKITITVFTASAGIIGAIGGIIAMVVQ